jgi:type III restriction enzyme
MALIDDPILNSPFREPIRHFKFDEDGITNEILNGRRPSSHFVPIPRAKKKGKQLQFETEWTKDRIEPNQVVDRIRQRVGAWRQGGYVGVTGTTARLLRYWTREERDKPLFFCQVEAIETAIYITEVARKYGDAWIENDLRTANDTSNPGLPRMTLKMATESGKTVVMAMLIAWQALNKLEDRQDARFSDAFLMVTPGITIRDRLRVLLPSDPENYYRQRDVLPPDLLERLGQARILITNYHAFLAHERGDAARLTKSILTRGEPSPFLETPDQVVRRVCRDLAGKKNIVVINDEAHHCYRRRPEPEGETALTAEERREAQKRDEEARVWLTGLEAVKNKIGVKASNYASGFELTLQPQMLGLPLRWKRSKRIFVNSMSDMFHVDVPLQFIQQAFDVMRRANWHQYQILTKRSERLLELNDSLEWHPHIWMGSASRTRGFSIASTTCAIRART